MFPVSFLFITSFEPMHIEIFIFFQKKSFFPRCHLNSHSTDFEQIENLAAIFADFEQVEKLVLLTLGRLSSDDCFLDDCFLNGCLLFKQVKNLVVILLTLSKSKKYLSLSRIYLHTLFMAICKIFHLSKSLLNCTHPFLLAFLICQSLYSSVPICMNVKTSKVLIFLFVKNTVTMIFD